MCGVRVQQHRPPPRLVNSGTNRPTSGLAEGRSAGSVPVNSANWPTRPAKTFSGPLATCHQLQAGSAVTLLRGAAAEQQELKDHLDRPRASGLFLSSLLSLLTSHTSGDSSSFPLSVHRQDALLAQNRVAAGRRGPQLHRGAGGLLVGQCPAGSSCAFARPQPDTCCATTGLTKPPAGCMCLARAPKAAAALDLLTSVPMRHLPGHSRYVTISQPTAHRRLQL